MANTNANANTKQNKIAYASDKAYVGLQCLFVALFASQTKRISNIPYNG